MVPAELRERQQWLAWQYRTRNGQRTKVPLSPLGGLGKSNDSATWGTYRQALAVLDADGIGFVFSPDDDYLGVDMDACVSDRGALHPAAYDIVRQLNGYTEFSPSGYGLHIIVRARLERGRHTLKTPWGNELALYSSGRFFTMSGEGRGEIREAQAEVNALISYYFPEEERQSAPVARPKPFSGHERDILDRVLGDARTERLWRGDASDFGGDHSAADLALCAHLAFWCGSDASRVDALFRQSGLMRDKWDSPRGDSTYGQETIRKALRQ